MRAYQDRKNAQAKVYYKDRFYVSPQLPKEEVDSDEVFAKDLAVISKKAKVKEAYIQRGQLVIILENRHDIVEVANYLKTNLNILSLVNLVLVIFWLIVVSLKFFINFFLWKREKDLELSML